MGNIIMNRPRQGLSKRKLAHCEAVSQVMWEEATRLGWPQEEAERASFLGFVHDFGRAFRPDGHSETGADILEATGCDLAFEVRNHGRLVDGPTPFLAMLWHADMTCDHEGKRCSYTERLNGIRERYGAESRQAANANALVTWLKANYPEYARHQREKEARP